MLRECFPRHQLQRKPLVIDPSMHHGTCITHVPWCMSGSLTRGGWENVPGIPGACATINFTYLIRDPWQINPLHISGPGKVNMGGFSSQQSNCRWFETLIVTFSTKVANRQQMPYLENTIPTGGCTVFQLHFIYSMKFGGSSREPMWSSHIVRYESYKLCICLFVFVLIPL